MKKPQRPRSHYRDRPYGSGTVRQRGDVFEARWTEAGQRKGQTFATQDEADEFLLARYWEQKRGTYRPPSELTVADLLRDWLDRHADTWASATLIMNRHYVDHYATPGIGMVKAVQLQPDQVQHWVDGLRRAKKGAPSIQHALRVVRQAFRHARLLTIVSEDPTRGVKAPKPPARDHVTWTADEVARVSSALQADTKWLAIYRLVLTTGIRPGEMLALQWPDLNLATGELTVRRTMTKAIGGSQRVGERTKGGKPRTIMLPQSTVVALKAWRKVQAADRLAATAWDSRDFVLTTRHGANMSLSQWHKYHDELIVRAGVRDIRLHDMRHTYATLAFERNIHPKIVQEVLGHRSIKITLDTYSHTSRDLQSAAAEALDAHLFAGDDRANQARSTQN